MNISKMKYVIDLSEKLNFTKVAKQHFISQTALSKQIQMIEKELGFSIFDRDTYRVKLTEAGSVFIQEVKVIVDKYEQALCRAKAVYQGLSGSLSCGYSDPIQQELLMPIVETMYGEYPNIDIRYIEQSFSKLVDKLMNDSCDIVFSIESELCNLKDIKKISLFQGKMVLAVSKKHPKATLGKIQAHEVADEKIILLNREAAPQNYKRMLESCRKDGYEPNIVEYVSSFDTFMLLIELNRGVSFMPETWMHKPNNRIAFLALENSHHTAAIEMAWKKDNKNPCLNRFIEVAKQKYLM